MKTKATGAHTCTLHFVGAGKPKKGGPYDVELSSSLAQEWASQGVLDPPAYRADVASRGFYFPEELE